MSQEYKLPRARIFRKLPKARQRQLEWIHPDLLDLALPEPFPIEFDPVSGPIGDQRLAV